MILALLIIWRGLLEAGTILVNISLSAWIWNLFYVIYGNTSTLSNRLVLIFVVVCHLSSLYHLYITEIIEILKNAPRWWNEHCWLSLTQNYLLLMECIQAGKHINFFFSRVFSILGFADLSWYIWSHGLQNFSLSHWLVFYP